MMVAAYSFFCITLRSLAARALENRKCPLLGLAPVPEVKDLYTCGLSEFNWKVSCLNFRHF